MKLTVNELAQIAKEIHEKEKLNTDLLRVKAPFPVQESASKNIKEINQIVEEYTGISTKNGKNLKNEEFVPMNNTNKKLYKKIEDEKNKFKKTIHMNESNLLKINLFNKIKNSVKDAYDNLAIFSKNYGFDSSMDISEVRKKLSELRVILSKFEKSVVESCKIKEMNESYLYDLLGYTFEGEIYTPEGMKAVAKKLGTTIRELTRKGLAAPFFEVDTLNFDEDIYATDEHGERVLISAHEPEIKDLDDDNDDNEDYEDYEDNEDNEE